MDASVVSDSEGNGEQLRTRARGALGCGVVLWGMFCCGEREGVDAVPPPTDRSHGSTLGPCIDSAQDSNQQPERAPAPRCTHSTHAHAACTYKQAIKHACVLAHTKVCTRPPPDPQLCLKSIFLLKIYTTVTDF